MLYSRKGAAVYCEISGRKFKRVGIVAAQMDGKIISPLQYEGTMDSSLFEQWFEQWFEQCLLPSLPEESVTVMDNATFHRKNRLFSLAESFGRRSIFLPLYSPGLNPIENFRSWLKRRLRKILPFHSLFDNALSSALCYGKRIISEWDDF